MRELVVVVLPFENEVMVAIYLWRNSNPLFIYRLKTKCYCYSLLTKAFIITNEVIVVIDLRRAGYKVVMSLPIEQFYYFHFYLKEIFGFLNSHRIINVFELFNESKKSIVYCKRNVKDTLPNTLF